MRRTATFLMLALAGFAAPGCGKGAKGSCPQLDICGGGNPGSLTPWQVTDYCQVQPVRPSQSSDTQDFSQMTLAPTVAPPQPNAVVSQQTTSGDWCSNLVFTQDLKVENANLWHEGPQISHDPAKPSTIIFGPDMTYLTKLIFEEQDATHFDPQCLVRNGAANPTCAALQAGLTAFYIPINMAVPPTYSNIVCTGDATTTGCDCTYNFNLQVDDVGVWGIDPNDPTVLIQDSTILQFNAMVMNAAAPTTMLRSSFCLANGQLSLSGWHGGSLSNVQGLRTLGLSPMH
jgi:hypothetical protein